jgi:hypothetical protein
VRDGPATDDQRDPETLTPEPGEGSAAGAGEGAEAGHGSAAGRRKRSWRQLMTIVVAAIILMLLIKAFVVQVYRIPSASMEDTLLTGDRVLVNKLVYHFRGIDRHVPAGRAARWGRSRYPAARPASQAPAEGPLGGASYRWVLIQLAARGRVRASELGP